MLTLARLQTLLCYTHTCTMNPQTLFPPLKNVKLGDTNELKSGLKLGLGGAPLGNLFTAVSDDVAQAIILQTIADGCQTFDTAPH